MPDLTEEVLRDIHNRMTEFLSTRSGYYSPQYIACGGSAATYSVSTPHGKRALKAYDPRLLGGSSADAEKRRLNLQRGLIGHTCQQLVEVYSVEEACGTAFVEMEFIEWPQLKGAIAKVPDEKVSRLIQELVTAVKYLESLGIVHRDIKPENIHISVDFEHLKLLDLGVARGIDVQEADSGAGTDHGNTRPFLATAQYSSPEYLFRLDEPSPLLWKALNLYQVGAVLHDLINKHPLFQDEVDKANRWLLARAVLTKAPSFPDSDPGRLARQKALASRCLVKDANVRMQIVGWADFSVEAVDDGLSSLQHKLAKSNGSAGAQSLAASTRRLDFERSGAAKRLSDAVKSELIAACNHQVGISMYPDERSPEQAYNYDFSLSEGVSICGRLFFDWGDGLHAETSTVLFSGILLTAPGGAPEGIRRALAVLAIGESEELTAHDVANGIATVIEGAIDLVDATQNLALLHGRDVGNEYRA